MKVSDMTKNYTAGMFSTANLPLKDNTIIGNTNEEEQTSTRRIPTYSTR